MHLNKVIRRFEEKYIPEPNSGCWLWIGSLWMGKRYGAFWIDKKFRNGSMVSAHVASIFLYKGINPKKGEEVCHICDNTFCVNPDHLFLGTHLDNMKDMSNKGRATKHNRKLSDDEIKMARILRGKEIKVKDLANTFNISSSHMSRIVSGVLPKYKVCNAKESANDTN